METKRFVGFWPWPRVWATEEAYNLAQQLKRLKSPSLLGEALSEEQTAIFRKVVVLHKGDSFEAQLCADGLILYRHHTRESEIQTGWERAKNDITAGFAESETAWAHYISALNILFCFFESELHCNGRNSYIYWVAPIGRTSVVRARYIDGISSSLTTYGPMTEMGLQRFVGEIAIGADLGGQYAEEISAAFQDACSSFEKALSNNSLWSFADRFSSAWTLHQIGQHSSSLILAWTLIERDLFEQLKSLVYSNQFGDLKAINNIDDLPIKMSARAERGLRA